jgi:parallel beta-helix repeat protein/predicted outer membrane repeat protein
MKHKLISLFVLLALLLAALPTQPARAASATIYVDADSPCFASCGFSWASAYPSLQTALTAAVSGDQIWVAEGVYYPGAAGDRAATFTLKTGVAIYGGFNGTETLLSQRDFEANPTILSGDNEKNDRNVDGNFIAEDTSHIMGKNAYHVVTGSGTDHTAILDGFVITAGKADGTSTDGKGGGIVLTSVATLTNLKIIGNLAYYGGGARILSSPTLTNVTISGNRALASGGGMELTASGSPQLINVTFSNNEAVDGAGGLWVNSSNPTLANVIFSDNSAPYGGGMRTSSGSSTLMNVTFSNNSATYGGAFDNDGDASLTNVTFSDNTATDSGGGMLNSNGDSTLTNVTFSGNSADQGGGMSIHAGNPTLTNVTFSGNSAAVQQGGGIYHGGSGTPTFTNTLIANSTGGDCVNNVDSSLHAASSHNLIEDSANACGLANGVDGNILGLDPQLGPLFDNGGSTLTYALLPASPAIDVGDNASCPATDQRGEARPAGLYCDIGAYEGEPHPYVVSITRADPNATNAASVDFNVTFSEPVDNVHDYDFQVSVTGTISDAEVTGITGDTTSGTVTVSTGTGTGTIRLDIPDGVGIVDAHDHPLVGLPYTSGESYSVRPQTFADVPMGYWAWNFIERLSLEGITGGCGGGNYCPTNPVTRAQMAVFLLKAMYGAAYVPADATGTVFNDVPADNIFAKWIEQLAAEGITGGCGGGNYCPNTPVSREQMAVFLLVAEHGTGYTPPAATGVFNDIPADYPFAPWIEALAAEGITGGCGGGNFCPKTAVNRGQMAVFLVAAFDLP